MADINLKIMQYTRIVQCISKEANVSLGKVINMFYNSKSFICLDEEIADYHCQGDLYIAEEIIDEYKVLQNKQYKKQ